MQYPRFCGLNRLCENSTSALDHEKPTSTDSIWRVLASGEGSDDPFFILQKQRFGVFTQSVQAAEACVLYQGSEFPDCFFDSLNGERWDAFRWFGAGAAGGHFCGLKAALLSPALHGYGLSVTIQ